MRMSEITLGHTILTGRGLGVHPDTSNQTLSRLASDSSEGHFDYILAMDAFLAHSRAPVGINLKF